MGREPGGYAVLDPVRDLDRHQSTNDTYPTALRVAAILALHEPEPALMTLIDAVQVKDHDLAAVVYVGRTQLQDAGLTTLGRSMGADADALARDRWRLAKCEERLGQSPDLVVTDSQAFLKVAADTPDGVPLTSVSILMARGAAAIDRLRAGGRVLISEAGSHLPQGDDIGRVRILRWLRQCVGDPLEFAWCSGHDFPIDAAGYDLVVHCGGCAFGRREMLARIARCRTTDVAITNYGLTIVAALGILERALSPFPAARLVWRTAHDAPTLRP